MENPPQSPMAPPTAPAPVVPQPFAPNPVQPPTALSPVMNTPVDQQAPGFSIGKMVQVILSGLVTALLTFGVFYGAMLFSGAFCDGETGGACGVFYFALLVTLGFAALILFLPVVLFNGALLLFLLRRLGIEQAKRIVVFTNIIIVPFACSVPSYEPSSNVQILEALIIIIANGFVCGLWYYLVSRVKLKDQASIIVCIVLTIAFLTGGIMYSSHSRNAKFDNKQAVFDQKQNATLKSYDFQLYVPEQAAVTGTGYGKFYWTADDKAFMKLNYSVMGGLLPDMNICMFKASTEAFTTPTQQQAASRCAPQSDQQPYVCQEIGKTDAGESICEHTIVSNEKAYDGGTSEQHILYTKLAGTMVVLSEEYFTPTKGSNWKSDGMQKIIQSMQPITADELIALTSGKQY